MTKTRLYDQRVDSLALLLLVRLLLLIRKKYLLATTLLLAVCPLITLAGCQSAQMPIKNPAENKKLQPMGKPNARPFVQVKPKSEDLFVAPPYRKWGYLGLEISDRPSDNALAQVQVTKVMLNTPAQIKKIYPGDYLLSVDEKPIPSSQFFYQQIRQTSIGSRVKLVIIRDGSELQKSLLVITFPQDEQLFICYLEASQQGHHRLAEHYTKRLRKEHPTSKYLIQL